MDLGPNPVQNLLEMLKDGVGHKSVDFFCIKCGHEFQVRRDEMKLVVPRQQRSGGRSIYRATCPRCKYLCTVTKEE